MALDLAEIVKQVKDRIYSSGLGEKPSIRQGSGTASVTGDIATFTMAAGEGDQIKAGQVLSSYGALTHDDAYGFYVLGVTSDVVTAVNGYDGMAIADSATMPILLEHQATTTEHAIHINITDIIDSYLWPELFDIFMESFSPSTVSLQSDANALDQEIIRAWQKIGTTMYQVPIKLVQNVPVAQFPSGKLLTYDVRSSVDVDYSVKRKVSIATSTDPALVGLITKGAAALCIEGVEQATHDENEARHDSRPLWASFYNAKRQFETAIAKESVTQFKVDRG